MPEPLDFDVKISLRVTDRSALYRASLAKARQDGLNRYEWRQIRMDPSHPSPVHADLQMLLDPGGRSGFSDLSGFKVYSTMASEVEDPDAPDGIPF